MTDAIILMGQIALFCAPFVAFTAWIERGDE